MYMLCYMYRENMNFVAKMAKQITFAGEKKHDIEQIISRNMNNKDLLHFSKLI